MAVAVAGDHFRSIAILGIRRWAAAVARTSQRRVELALNHRLDELTYPLTQPDLDRVKPIVEKMDRRLRFRLQGPRHRASVAHGVVSTGEPTPGLIWVSSPGDYAIINSNHIPDDTLNDLLDDHLRHAIGDGGHTQNPLAPSLFGNGDRTHRRWKVGSRTHSIPDLVEIVLQVGFELLDCLPVHAGRTSIGFDRFIGFVHSLLFDIERLAC